MCNIILRDLVIPNDIKRVNRRNIKCYPFLSSIFIPSSVTAIERDTFQRCFCMKNNFINNSKLDAEANNYWGATLVDEITDGLVIKDGVAITCSCDAKTVVIPNGVTKIKDSCFRDCRKLTRVIIPDSVTSIGNDAFRNCHDLSSVTIPNSVTHIGYCAFMYCENLTNVSLPKNLTCIRTETFAHCTNLMEITIPDNVNSIQDYAFAWCPNIKEIIIPKNTTYIGNDAFKGCKHLRNVIFGNNIFDYFASDAFYDTPISLNMKYCVEVVD